MVSSGIKSEAGHFIVETVELRAAFAASSTDIKRNYDICVTEDDDAQCSFQKLEA